MRAGDAGTVGGMTLGEAASYRQRQWLPVVGWLSIFVFFASLAIAYGAAAGARAGWVSAAIGTLLTPLVARLMSQAVVITNTANAQLSAGAATIALALLGEVRVLDKHALTALRADPAAASGFWVAPGWCPGAVVCAVNDDADPHAFWVIGSNQPQELAEAINRHRRTESRHGTMST